MFRISSPVLERPPATMGKARIFLLVDLRDFFSDLGSGDKKNKKKL